MIYAVGVAGVGQTRRAVRLAEYVCSLFDAAAALVLTGIPNGEQLFRSERTQVVSLAPIVDLVRSVQQSHGSDAVTGRTAAATSALQAVAAEFDPDVFLTTTHAGIAGELRALLERFGAHGRRRVLALRDVYWPPHFVEEFERLSANDFDGVIVGGPPETSTWIPVGLLQGALASTLRFVGYLRPIEEGVLPSVPTSPIVRCQVGSGSDGYALAAAVIAVAPMLREGQPACRVHVSTGPLMPEENRRRLSDASGDPSVVVEPWIVDPFGSTARPARPAVVVSMAGYNACVEAAWFGTPTILCPRRCTDDSEQEIRARLFADRFENLTVVDGPDPDALLQAICNPPRCRTDRLDGAKLAVFAEPRHAAGLVLGEMS